MLSPGQPDYPRSQIVVIGNEKSSGLAAVLSFFWCGLGQIYTGQIGKGVTMMALYPVLLAFGLMSTFGGCFAVAGASNSSEQGAAGGILVIGLMLLVGASSLWLYGMVNAYRTAERANNERFRRARALSSR